MLALHWPSDPDLWTLAFGHWSRRTLVAIGAGRFGARHFRLGMVRETVVARLCNALIGFVIMPFSPMPWLQ